MYANRVVDTLAGPESTRAADSPSADADTFRAVMASVCTPVTIVTAMVDGRPHGTTVSAFASLSLRPPMVLLALGRQSRLLRLIRATGRFGVNVLGSGQIELARTFACAGNDRFDGVAWMADGDLPRLHDTVGWLACEKIDLVSGGDHMVVLGRVLAASLRDGGSPLTYYRRGFGSHQAATDSVGVGGQTSARQ